ncbi:uncharacterized protein LOC121386813 [Gigantopelta aegis]|uniref:uncharacterized protein LOC121386813 n=1 Tax=Gigantopelta aegis TaxID=1735272 RepID=UPI001B8874D6|nr:uncharacterized protein LOC121386813 [Gigantopelta aegis]
MTLTLTCSTGEYYRSPVLYVHIAKASSKLVERMLQFSETKVNEKVEERATVTWSDDLASMLGLWLRIALTGVTIGDSGQYTCRIIYLKEEIDTLALQGTKNFTVGHLMEKSYENPSYCIPV